MDAFHGWKLGRSLSHRVSRRVSDWVVRREGTIGRLEYSILVVPQRNPGGASLTIATAVGPSDSIKQKPIKNSQHNLLDMNKEGRT